jgi:hypothetical protein
MLKNPGYFLKKKKKTNPGYHHWIGCQRRYRWNMGTQNHSFCQKSTSFLASCFDLIPPLILSCGSESGRGFRRFPATTRRRWGAVRRCGPTEEGKDKAVLRRVCPGICIGGALAPSEIRGICFAAMETAGYQNVGNSLVDPAAPSGVCLTRSAGPMSSGRIINWRRVR